MIGSARELGLAMLIADLSGYTALTESHGALKASEIVLRFVRLVERTLEPGVRIVNSIGDEVFCTGASTLAVVRSALRIHEAVTRERDLPRVRIGVHRGPVVEREGRLFGAPINLTARLAAYAGGGRILCTEPIARAASVFADIESRPIGEHRFKNVAQPVAVFELARASERRAAAAVDPVCRMQIALERAAATIVHDGATYIFCSHECERAFLAAPKNYVQGGRGT